MLTMAAFIEFHYDRRRSPVTINLDRVCRILPVGDRMTGTTRVVFDTDDITLFESYTTVTEAIAEQLDPILG
jgi:hypothetical protein